MKHFTRARKYGARVVSTVAVLSLPLVALAEPAGDYDAIIDAVDWAAVITGIGAIAALIAAVLVVKRGAGMLLRMIGR